MKKKKEAKPKADNMIFIAAKTAAEEEKTTLWNNMNF